MSIYDKASLVLIPSGTKTSKVYSQKPVSGDGDFTFSRSTAATRVNADGVIEKETQNLLLQSNSFDTTWANTGSTLTSGQSGYNGNNAWLLHTSSTPQRIEQNVSVNGVSTFSVYGKSGTANYLRVQTQTAGTDVFFDVANGTIAYQEAAAIDATITDVGNGWYRCSMTINENVTNVRILVQSAIYGVNVGDNIYIQDAQLEQGLVARDYIETTTAAVEGGITDNVPRLDYTDSSCPALLLEPQRTNRYYHSEHIAGWVTASNVTRTANYAESPEGVDNATRLQFTGNGFLYNSPTQANATQYTLSCYAKRNDSGTQSVGFFRNGSGSVDSAWSLTSDWQRFTYTYTSSNASFAGIAGTNGADVSVFGFQMEEGSYATSYIPTYGSAVTRNNEPFDCEDIQTNGLITSTQGSFFVETSYFDESSIQFDLRAINNNNYSLRLRIRNTSILVYEKNNGTQTLLRTISGLSAGLKKVSLAWNGINLTTSVNGTSYTNTISSGLVSNINEIGRANQSSTLLQINKMLLFPTQLTESELNDLTTL